MTTTASTLVLTGMAHVAFEKGQGRYTSEQIARQMKGSGIQMRRVGFFVRLKWDLTTDLQNLDENHLQGLALTIAEQAPQDLLVSRSLGDKPFRFDGYCLDVIECTFRLDSTSQPDLNDEVHVVATVARDTSLPHERW